METAALPAFVRDLLVPAVYDHEVEECRLLQTHISYVILAGNFVYKFKKPVNFGFLDFSTLEKRQHCCEQELTLNRRLCPHIYLGLVRVTEEEDGRHALDGAGRVVEYGVRMTRMPEERMMGNLIRAGQLGKEHIDAIVDALVPFYAAAERSAVIDPFGSAEGVAVNVLENFAQTRGFIGQGALAPAQFITIEAYAKTVLAQPELFARRIAEGRVRDCHGDLYSANICLADRVYIYDCIEFNERFRYCDVASDIAFLAMDLDHHGLTALSDYFVTCFEARSRDASLRTLLNFYMCYRAYVRGKIGLFTAADPAVGDELRRQCIDQAKRYFALAEGYAVAA